MTLAMFKLESFTNNMTGKGAVVTYTQEAFDRAYLDGVEEGLARKEEEGIRNLTAGLASLQRSLTQDEALRSQLRQEVVGALVPLLDEILDRLTPATESLRLQQALTEELVRLSKASTPLRLTISCSPSLRNMVERCLDEADLRGIDLIETDSDRISLSLHGGRIELSPEQIANDIRQLISELKGEDTTWTH